MAFRQHPGCLMIPEKNIMSTMEYFVNKLRISKYPQFLNLSLEKRIIPRTSAIKVLVSNGVVKKTHSIHRVLRVTDKVFLDEFVIPGKDECSVTTIFVMNKGRDEEISPEIPPFETTFGNPFDTVISSSVYLSVTKDLKLSIGTGWFKSSSCILLSVGDW
ncbi:hypothetical protein IFM89_021733 [Coptis chinensis]|uniref:Uncharacterized protein n=1 Tax=Coptis chinensis TaxID=261450 RepID=A0A835HL82_9MAGN|nr:hypothetical protein IFM89_021733 [Coptis chinensis]